MILIHQTGAAGVSGLSAYLDTVAEEINEALQAAGRLVVSDLYKRFSLPLEFLNQIIDARLGQAIHGQRDASDGNALYTPTYVARQRAVVRGAALAVTRCAAAGRRSRSSAPTTGRPTARTATTATGWPTRSFGPSPTRSSS